MLKRAFDVFASGIGLIVLSPVFICLGVWIKADSKGPVFYRQTRVGKDNKDFFLYKFRSMRPGSDKAGLITVGGRDPRVTRSGYYIRKFKLDELPQLINVFKGEMSLVGPRPEVRRYVDLYNEDQLRVLDVKPGITSLASLKYSNENEILALADDPDRAYIEKVMPEKLDIDLEYVPKANLITDIGLIFKTIGKIAGLYKG